MAEHVPIHIKESSHQSGYLHVPKDHAQRKKQVMIATTVSMVIIVAIWVLLWRWNFAQTTDESQDLDLSQELEQLQQQIQGVSDDFTEELNSFQGELQKVEVPVEDLNLNENVEQNTQPLIPSP